MDNDDSNTESISLTLQDFEIGSFLGDGGYGQVVAAYKRHTMFPIALKFISKEKIKISDDTGITPMLAQVQREIEIQMMLSHQTS